jgi:hypothetical protein
MSLRPINILASSSGQGTNPGQSRLRSSFKPISEALWQDKGRDITRILQNIEKGESKAADELLPLVYAELLRLCAPASRQKRTRSRTD